MRSAFLKPNYEEQNTERRTPDVKVTGFKQSHMDLHIPLRHVITERKLNGHNSKLRKVKLPGLIQANHLSATCIQVFIVHDKPEYIYFTILQFLAETYALNKNIPSTCR